MTLACDWKCAMPLSAQAEDRARATGIPRYRVGPLAHPSTLPVW